MAVGSGGHKYGLIAVRPKVIERVSGAAAAALMNASRYPMCCANQRLAAPACSAACTIASISGIGAKPST